MPLLRVKIHRCDLPSADIAMINHPDEGLVLLVDHRVDEGRIGEMLRVLSARAGLHPERVRRAACYRSGPDRVLLPPPTTLIPPQGRAPHAEMLHRDRTSRYALEA